MDPLHKLVATDVYDGLGVLLLGRIVVEKAQMIKGDVHLHFHVQALTTALVVRREETCLDQRGPKDRGLPKGGHSQYYKGPMKQVVIPMVQ